LPPISRPTKIICMGGNFSNHLQEGSTSLPPFPISFLKSPTSLVGHRAPIFYPRRVKLLDYEVELAAVIGVRCKDVSRKSALNHIAGFSVFNDISARDIQFAEMKRGFCNLGKNFASFAPMGPFLVTPDQAGNPDNHGMELRVNGQTRQFSSTKNMVFKMRQLVEFFSSMTLEPGDIITSGTPSGVAIYRQPDKTPFLLQPGDMIESKIENLGRLQNTVVAETSPEKTAFWGPEDHSLARVGLTLYPLSIRRNRCVLKTQLAVLLSLVGVPSQLDNMTQNSRKGRLRRLHPIIQPPHLIQ